MLPEFLDDYVGEDNPVRAIDVFVDELDLRGLGFSGVVPEVTGRPAYRPATLLKIYVYGYLNRIQSSRRLEQEDPTRNIELMWLDRPTGCRTSRRSPTSAATAGRRSARRARSSPCCAVSSTFSRELSFADRREQVQGGEQSRQELHEWPRSPSALSRWRPASRGATWRSWTTCRPGGRRYGRAKTIRLKEKIEGLRRQMQSLREIGASRLRPRPTKQVSLTDPDARSMATSGKGTGNVGYNVQNRRRCRAPSDRRP